MSTVKRRRSARRAVNAEKDCSHTSLVFEPSDRAADAGYKPHSLAALHTAATGSEKPDESDASLKWRSDDFGVSSGIFPAPLVLQDDELAWSPDYPAQPLRSWKIFQSHCSISETRKVLYVGAEPGIDDPVSFMQNWSAGSVSAGVAKPSPEHVMEYLTAFYHGVEVKQLPIDWDFTSWDDENAGKKARSSPAAVGLANRSAGDVTRIRVRKSRDKKPRLSHQLSLNDLLDVAINVLPQDAFALLMLVSFDMYEDEDDDFCCGRAYGGSRVSVVSSARYHPDLDQVHTIDRLHSWPASHCASFVSHHGGWQPKVPPSRRNEAPLQSALNAFDESSNSIFDDEKIYGTWLGRTVRTAAHELGHCFGMDHCVYYACVMQGTASLVEDVRQPPDLCPVDLSKVIRATRLSVAPDTSLDNAIFGRYEALLKVCERHAGIEQFDAFAAWLRAVLDGWQNQAIVVDDG